MTSRTPRIERLWWSIESFTWDDRLADPAQQADIDNIVGWVTSTAGSRDERVLDIGCGTGNHAIAVARSGARVTGVDISPAMLRRARAKARDLDVELMEVDLHAGLPFADGSFDCVLSVHVLQMVRDPAAFLDEVRRVLAPGGRLVLAGFPQGDATRLSTERTTRRRDAFAVLKRALVRRSSRVRLYEPVELAELVGAAGFVDIDERRLPGRLGVIARR